MSFSGIVRETVAEMTVAAFRVGMAGLLLDLSSRHHELGISEARHLRRIAVAVNTLVARLVSCIENGKGDHKHQLACKNNHAFTCSEEVCEFIYCHTG